MEEMSEQMVNIAGALPKGEANGLDVHARELAGALVNGRKYFVVGVISTDSVKTKQADLAPVPTVRFERLEMVPFEDDLETPASQLLQRIADVRTGGVGQARFDFDSPAPEAAEPAGPAAIESGDGMFFSVVDDEPGRFSLFLNSPYVTGLTSRSGLLRSEMGEIPPGDYQLAHFEGALGALAARVLADWNSGGGAVDDVVDAEVVEDDGEVIDGVEWPADAEGADVEGGDSE